MNLREEKKLWRQGFKRIVGLDEAGRGSLSGPVVAAAAMVSSRIFTNLPRISRIKNKKISEISGKFVQIREVRDSKKLTPKKREQFYKLITKSPFIEWGIGRVGPKVIDRINILEATKLAMKRAIKNLRPDFLILDGRMELNCKIPQKSIVKADEKVFSCQVASIIAKVQRDKAMTRYHKKYAQYGFDKHKGYGTKLHLKMLKKHGPCKIHRKSFAPVKTCLSQ